MSLTTYDSLKLENLTPDRVVGSDAESILVDSPILVTSYDIEVSGDLVAENARVTGNLEVAGAMTVHGNLTARQDVTFSTFAGEGTRPVVVDSQGKLQPGAPEVQQIFAHFASVQQVPADTDPLDLLPGDDDESERGSLQIPVDWWAPGKRLTLILVLAWEKQAGISSDLDLILDLADESAYPNNLASIPLSHAALEGSVPTSGSGVLEIDLQVGDIWGCGDTTVEVFGSYRFNNSVRGRFQLFAALQGWWIRAQAHFSSASGTNSVTVHAASMVAYEQPPYASTLIA